MDDVRLAICLPLVSEQIEKRFFFSWTVMKKPAEYNLIVPTLHPGEFQENIAAIRNNLIEQALSEDCTHIVMMDTDQRYPRDTLTKLLNHNLPIVGAKVHRRYSPFDPLLIRGRIGKYWKVPDEEWENHDGLIEVDATGTGCLMIQSEVFKKLEYPWFKILPTRGKRRAVGEDIYFCSKAKKAGFPIFVDVSIEIGHFTTLEINKNFYKLMKIVKGTAPKPTSEEDHYK